MKIAKLLFAMFLLLGGFSIAKSGDRVLDAHRAVLTDRQLAIAAQARSDWYEGTVAMSFERSVMQVALALDDPIPPDFKRLIDDQRAVSDRLLAAALETIATLDDFDNADRFTAEVAQARDGIARLRTEADRTLARPATERDAGRTHALPYALKGLIETLHAAASLLVLPDGTSTTAEMTLSRVQSLAWEVREYGGRARTFYAIATLTGQPIPLRALGEAQIDTARARAAWHLLQLAADSSPLPSALLQDIATARASFGGDYLAAIETMDQAMDRMRSGDPTPMPYAFADFFALSNAGLASVAGIAPAAGDHIQAYWAATLQDARLTRALSSLGMAVMALLIGSSLWVMQRKVIRPIQAATQALTDISEGRLGREFRQRSRGFDELKVMWDGLEKLTQNLRAARDQDAAERAAERREKEGIIEELTAAFARMSQGDLTYEIRGDYGPGYRALIDDFNATGARLRSAMADVVVNATDIADRADALGSAIRDLAARTDQQSSMVADTAGRLKELSEALQNTSENTRESARTATEAAERSIVGSTVVESAITTMDLIKTTSARINEFSGVIDDIAFQTGILSLNAGVEAARAGEAGKGFAIVAQEVRGLATRASDSAHRIKEMVDESEANITNGVEEVTRTGNSLGEITQMVQAVQGHIRDIDEAARFQADMLGRIGDTMSEIDDMTKRNAAMADDATRTSEALRQASGDLKGAVGQFVIATAPAPETTQQVA